MQKATFQSREKTILLKQVIIILSLSLQSTKIKACLYSCHQNQKQTSYATTCSLLKSRSTGAYGKASVFISWYKLLDSLSEKPE